jgi:glutathione S-transferase
MRTNLLRCGLCGQAIASERRTADPVASFNCHVAHDCIEINRVVGRIVDALIEARRQREAAESVLRSVDETLAFSTIFCGDRPTMGEA